MATGKLGEAVDRVKGAVGGSSGPPDADEVEGRVGIVRAALRAWGQGDHDGFFAALDDDVEWIAPSGSKFPGSGTIRGRDQVREKMLGAVEDAYQDFGFRPERYLEASDVDWVVVLGSFQGTPLKGQELDAPGVMIWELDGKEAERVRVFTDSELFHEPAPDEEEQKRKEQERKRSKDEDGDGDRAKAQSGGREGDEPGGAGGSEGTATEGGADVPGRGEGESKGEGGMADLRGEERHDSSGGGDTSGEESSAGR